MEPHLSLPRRASALALCAALGACAPASAVAPATAPGPGSASAAAAAPGSGSAAAPVSAPVSGSAAAPVSGSAAAPVSAAVSAAAPVSAPASLSSAPAGSPPRRASLRFETGGRPFPSPLADAVVGGQPTTLLVDTGASQHVIAEWLAAELSLPLAKSDTVGVDHVGQKVRASRLQGARLVVSGWGPAEASSLLVVAVPDALRSAGIGGVLSPQSLAPDGRAVVLDLRAGVMTEAPADEALRGLEGLPGAGRPVALTTCGTPQSGLELTVPATLQGAKVVLKVDTGASQTSVLASSSAGKQLSAGVTKTRAAYHASGKHTVAVREGAQLTIGGLSTSLDIDLQPGTPRAACPSDGFLGMDALRACVIVLSGPRSSLACSPL